MRIKIKGIKDIAHKYKNFFFDLDGVMVIFVTIFSGGVNNPFRVHLKH